MEPRLGSSIVIMNPVEEPVSGPLIEGIDKYSAGFDKAKLGAVIDKLMAVKEV